MTDPGAVTAFAGGTILLTRRAGVVEVQLNRPEKRNALTAAMISGLHEALAIVEAERPRVLVLRGGPGCFCAGADIAAYRTAALDATALAAFTAQSRELCRRLTTVDAIVVAVVDGIAMGGGFELVLAADLVVASETTRFGLPEVKLGLIPGWGGTQRLAHYVGPNRAKEAILTGAAFGPEEAGGLVNRIVPSTEVESAASALIDTLVAQAPLALGAAKASIATAYDPQRGETTGARLETQHLLALFASDDGREGVAAFVEKRTPIFTGR
jgi:enoyl-CoA hydratase/carnithine racemase